MFNYRPSPIQMKKKQIDKLQGDLDEALNLVENLKSEIAEIPVSENNPEMSIEQMKDELRKAEVNFADHDALLCALKSPIAMDAYRCKKRGDVYSGLLHLQKIDRHTAELHVAYLKYRIIEAEYADAELRREEILCDLQNKVKIKPLNDWRCERYFNGTVR